MNESTRIFYCSCGSRIFYCSCGCSMLVVSLDELDPKISISPWTPVNFDGHSWHAKWQFIRHILKWGHPYTDFVLHTPKQARELGNYLIEMTNEVEQNG